MKNLLFVLLISLPFLSIAQNSGTVQYEEIMKLEIKFPEDMDMSEEQLAQIKAMMPKEQRFKKVLYFDKNAALYKDIEMEEDDDQSSEFGSEESGFKFKMMRANMDNRFYTDLKAGGTIDKSDFMGKTFLIKGEADEIKWKMTGKQAKIGDYMCMQATMKDEERTVEAWFTPQIPIAVGPEKYGQLPGLILKVVSKSEHGERTIVATDVELGKVKKGMIVAPKKGKEVTKEEYEEIIEAKMKEMKEMHGGSGGVHFKVGH